MHIYCVNHSTVLADNEIEACLPAFNTYIRHVKNFWPCPAFLYFVTPDNLPADVWTIVVADDSDQAGALGYHDYSPSGKPISYVFAKTDKEYGYSWTVTLTHELAEMMADPYISTAIQVTNDSFYAQEIGDPVEDDSLGYKIRAKDTTTDVLVSDFVTPAWFIPGHPGPVYDHARHCNAPLQLLPGGYMSIFKSGKGWTQIYAEKDTAKAEEVGMNAKAEGKGPYSRPERYARDRGKHTLKVADTSS
jgi:hypothetical protein